MDQFLFRYRRRKIAFVGRLLDKHLFRTLENNDVTIIAITGSIGKTSAKVAISQLLETRYKMVIEDENHNSDRSIRLNFFGLPFPVNSRSLLAWVPVLKQVRERSRNFPYDMVVLEMAESRQASLSPFIKKLKPAIGVVTGVSPVHLSYFKTYERVVKAVWHLARLCQTIIYNADFEDLAKQPGADQARSYGLQQGRVHLTQVRTGKGGLLEGTLHIGSKKTAIKTNMVAEQALYAVVSAAAVADQLGWSLPEIVDALPHVKPVRGRMNPLAGRKQSTILDDSFNASPLSMQAALQTLKRQPGYKIAVLGSMNELSTSAPEAHVQVGKQSAAVVDELVVIGDVATQYLAPAAIKAGLDPQRVHTFAKASQAGECLNTILQTGSTVLFKGSQGDIYIEEAIKHIMAHPAQAEDCLVRQGGVWERRKASYFTPLAVAEEVV